MLQTFKCVTFWFIVVGSALSMSLLILPFYPFRSFLPRIYRQFSRICEQMFGSLLVVVTSLYAKGVIVLSGEHVKLDASSQCVVMANHQIYPDWWYLWIFAWLKGTHGDLKIILMDYLKYIPVLGQGMWLLEFVFMKQKWAIDKIQMKRHFASVKATGLPFWLLIFPEGTLNTPNNRTKSQAYAEKMHLLEKPVHVILPKSTGLFYSLHTLQPEVKILIDVTVGYGGITADEVPYDEYLVENVFFKGKKPKGVYMHVRLFEVAKIPGFESMPAQKQGHLRSISDLETAVEDPKRKSDFDQWLRARFMEKDHLMRLFYETGGFDGDALLDDQKYALAAGINDAFKHEQIAYTQDNFSKDIKGRVVHEAEPELVNWIMFGFLWYALVYITGPAYYWAIVKAVKTIVGVFV